MTPAERALVAAVAAAAAAGGALAGAHPTANRASDLVVTAGFAALVAVACSISRTWTWIVLAGAAAVFSGGSLQLAGFGLELVAIGAVLRDLPARRVVGAALGGIAAQLLLRLGAGPFLGSTALIAGAATVPVLASGWRIAHGDTRAVVRRGAYVLGAAAAIAVLAAGFSLIQARSATNLAIARVRSGLDAARQGDAKGASSELARAADFFATAHDEASSLWARPASLLPLVGQQVASIDRLTGAGEKVAAVAAKATADAHVDSFQLRGGTIDVQGIADAQRPLGDVLAALQTAQGAIEASRSDWLLWPLADRLRAFEGEVARATDEADTASIAVKVAPALLGGDGPRHYFVIFANPSESRDLGGFMGGWGELLADHGHLSLERTGTPGQLDHIGPHPLTDPSRFPSRYLSNQLDRFWGNVPGTDDFPTVAEAVRQMWPASGGGPLDGVLYVDPYALSALLRLTGPVDAPELGQTLTADNIVPFLLRDQYEQLHVNDERHDLLSVSAHSVFDKITSSDLPGPRQVADALGSVAHQGRLLLHSYHPDEQALFARLGIDGAVPPVAGDYLGLTVSNAGPNKIDSYLRRSIAADVTVDPATGAVDSTVQVTLSNDAPPSGLPTIVIGNDRGQPPGTNVLVAAVSTPLALQSATLDSQPVAIGAHTEYGRKVYVAGIDIPPGASRTLELQLSGAVQLDQLYRLLVVPQAAVGIEHISVKVRAVEGWKASTATGMERKGLQAQVEKDLAFATELGVTFATT